MTAATAGGATEIFGLPMSQYAADLLPGIEVATLNSSTAHRLLTRSPLHAWYKHPRLNPAWREEVSDKFDLGAAAHAVFLEGDFSKFAVYNGDTWRSGDSRAFRELARAEGKIPLLMDDFKRVEAMAHASEVAMLSSPSLTGLGPLDAERTLIWQEDGTWLRCRPDALTTDREIVVSYKTTTDASPARFIRTAIDLGYGLQSVFEVRGLQKATGSRRTPAHLWIVQEVNEPYAVSLIGMSPEWWHMAQEQFDAAVSMWRHCLETDRWDGYSNRICYMDPPPWAVSQWEALGTEES